jgi:predicted transcriptional regulator
MKLVETVEIEVMLDDEVAETLEAIASDTGLSIDTIITNALVDHLVSESLAKHRKSKGLPVREKKFVDTPDSTEILLKVVWKAENWNEDSGAEYIVSLEHKDTEPFDLVVPKALYDYFITGRNYRFVLDGPDAVEEETGVEKELSSRLNLRAQALITDKEPVEELLPPDDEALG